MVERDPAYAGTLGQRDTGHQDPDGAGNENDPRLHAEERAVRSSPKKAGQVLISPLLGMWELAILQFPSIPLMRGYPGVTPRSQVVPLPD